MTTRGDVAHLLLHARAAGAETPEAARRGELLITALTSLEDDQRELTKGQLIDEVQLRVGGTAGERKVLARVLGNAKRHSHPQLLLQRWIEEGVESDG